MVRDNSQMTPDIALLTKPECHLCQDARAVVAEVCEQTGHQWREVVLGEVTEFSAERYAEEIPVLFIDGVQRDFWMIDPHRMKRLLAEAEQSR